MGARGLQQKNDFSTGSIPLTITRLALPMIGAQLVNATYNVVDRIYIGAIPGYGALPLTGVGLTYPLIALITAFANLCGMGGAPLMSIARGEGRNEHAERILGTAAALLLGLSAVLLVLGYLYMEPLLWMFGASESTIGYATDYFSIYLVGTPFVLLTLGLNPFVTSQGFARTGMMTILIGAVANILLDPWLLSFLHGKRAIIRLKPKYIRFAPAIVKRILALGVSNFTMGVTESAVSIVNNSTLQTYGSLAFPGGGDVYVGIMTVISTLRQLTMLGLNGLSNGASPVMSFNYGAKRYDRVRKSVKFFLLVCLIYAVACWAILMLFPEALIRIFNADPQLIEYGVPATRIYFCAFFAMFMQMVGQTSFVALGKARQATFFSLLRKAFIVVPLALLLPRLTNLGVFGVFIAEPISDLVGSSCCFATFMLTVYRRMGETEK